LAEDISGSVNAPVFVATLRRRPPSLPVENIVVKMVPQNYGVDVHPLSATEGLAPKLYAISSQNGIPNAYVMEHLPSPWIALYSLDEEYPSDFYRHSQEIYDILKKVTALLEENDFVHGGLRSNKILVNKDALEKEGKVDIKIVDFDWNGKAGKTWYPGSWIPEPEDQMAWGSWRCDRAET
jgi:hypothetical protein